MQLVAYGAQDVYLTGDPQITYFRVVYRRHTNFSMECIEQTFNGTISAGSTASATISRNGDLIGAMHIEYKQANDGGDSGGTDNNDKYANVIEEVTVEIGGQKIDKHYGKWLDIWADLTDGTAKKKADLMKNGQAFVPLQFWFNRNAGLALPLIALQYHEVKVIFKWGTEMSTAKIADPTLWVDYIYLDTEERKRFAQMSHEYLIDQLQRNVKDNDKKTRLNFNHPVKEIVWDTSDAANAKLTLNGHDRFATRESDYFTKVQRYYHHTDMVTSPTINVYSFALRPEEHQPSGTCNFSRIDNATIEHGGAGVNSDTVYYAVNYNVLRIVSGMGGLAYSN